MNADESPSETPSLTRRRRTFLAPLWLLALGGVLMLAAAVVYWNSATTTTIVLLRHAEKESSAITDAPLSPEGESRSTRLAQMFGDAEKFGRVQKIYVTNTRRTQQTAGSLEQRLNLPGVVVDSKTEAGDIARQVLRENRGGVALVIGHSNTIPEIVAALTHRHDVPPIGEEEFDTLYVVTVPTIGQASVLRMKY